MTYVLSYSEESAKKAGGGEYVSEGGAYVCKILEAKFVESSGKQTKGIEFSVETSERLKSNFLTVYYAKANGEPVTGGQSVLNAMMGIMSLQGISKQRQGDTEICPELTGKFIGLFLQKVLFTKQDGSEGYKFDIRVPFHPKTRQTLKEMADKKDAATIDRLTESYKDKDERGQNHANGNGSAPPAYGYGYTDADIPGF